MWINILTRNFNFTEYLQYTILNVLYRQQSLLIGLNYQRTLVSQQRNELKSALPIKNLSIRGINYIDKLSKKHSPNYDEGQFKKSIFETYLKNRKEWIDFLGEKEEWYVPIITECLSHWVNDEDRKVDELMMCIDEKIFKKHSLSKKAHFPESKFRPDTYEEFQESIERIYGGFDAYINTQKEQLKIISSPSDRNYLRNAKKLYKMNDNAYLKIIEKNSFGNAVMDLVITFENWIVFYFESLIIHGPDRFLNTKGLPRDRFEKKMMKIIKNFSKDDPEQIERLILQETKNIGYSGSNFDTYFVDHAGFNIPFENKSNFGYYTELRLLRNDIVHPISSKKSKLTIPTNIGEFEEIIKNLIELGRIMISICSLDNMKMTEDNVTNLIKTLRF
ncbi:MAG: hypothetical protein HeimC3_30090 [Candidatus Heimdallarchaeota archaeon LC_3]|nr:MAG: hypothetical protein HeimC3_30090 [Candidatus Heimdallarchaeota archaeon LC_3]